MRIRTQGQRQRQILLVLPVIHINFHFQRLLQFGFSSVQFASVFRNSMCSVGNRRYGWCLQLLKSPQKLSGWCVSGAGSVDLPPDLLYFFFFVFLFCVPVTTRNYGRHPLPATLPASQPRPTSLPAPLVAVTKRPCPSVCVRVPVCVFVCRENQVNQNERIIRSTQQKLYASHLPKRAERAADSTLWESEVGQSMVVGGAIN